MMAQRSLVRILFPNHGEEYTYYNDAFDLRVGDQVFVSGKLAGQRGVVLAVEHTFQIKLSQYQRVLSVAQREVHGRFQAAGAYLICKDEAVLPPEQVQTWFFPPEEEPWLTVMGETQAYPLETLAGLPITPAIAERGHAYYTEGRVRYLQIKKGMGYAVVEGKLPYEVRFHLQDGMVSSLLCTCPCYGVCKHQFAVLQQLKELLHHGVTAQTGCMTAVYRPLLLSMALTDGSSIEL